MRLWSALAAVVVAVPFAFAGEVHEAASQLHRVEGSPQREIAGACSIREGDDFQRFTVVVEGANEDSRLIVLLASEERLQSIGELAAGSSRRVLEKTTREGGELPFGVDRVSALSGRRVRVVDGEEHTLLDGEVPAFDRPDGGGDDGGGDDGDGHDGGDGDDGGEHREPATARSYMHRTDAAGDRESRGIIVVQRREDSSVLRFECDRLAPETGYIAFIEAGERREAIDDFRTGPEGGADVRRDTALGQELPFGAARADELAGKRIEIEDLEHHVVLYGEIPYFENEGEDEGEEHHDVHEEARDEDEESGADVRIEVDIRHEEGREKMRIECRDIPREDGRDDGTRDAKASRRRAEILLADDGGSLQTVADVPVRRGGKAVWRYLARRGDELPFGADSLRDLAGRAYEIRVDGVRIASGTLPQF